MPGWVFYPLGFLLFVLPSVAVTVKSGATTVFLLFLIPALMFGWRGWGELFAEEKVILCSMLLFVLFSSFSLINSSNISEAMSSFEKHLRFLAFIPMYLLVRRNELNLGPWLLLGCLFGCVVMGLVASYEFHMLGENRPNGVRNAARFGLVAVIAFLLLVHLLIVEWRNKIILFAGIIASGLIVYAITLNQTRSAMILLLPFFALMILYCRERFNKTVIIFISIIFFMVLLFSVHPSSPVAKRFAIVKEDIAALRKDPIENYKSSTGLRLHMVYTGVSIFIQSPMFGTGFGDYALDAQALMDSGKTYVKDGWLLTSPHNIYVNALAETGIVGFVGLALSVFFAPFYCYIKLSSRRKNDQKIRFYIYAGTTCLLSYLIFGLFHTWTNINNSVSIFLLLQLVFISNGFNLMSKNIKY